MKAWLARFDTLFVRLFVLLWVALVASHVIAYAVVHSLAAPPGGRAESLDARPLPTFPSLPPNDLTGGPPGGSRGPGPGAPPPPRLDVPGQAPPEQPRSAPGPGGMLWLDYVVRLVVIALFAAWGASWLARPMRRLAEGSRSLETALAGAPVAGSAPGDTAADVPQIDASRGPVEVRASARVFNGMARRLHQQFASRTLFMAAISHDLRTPLTRLRLRLEARRATPAVAADIDAGIADLREMDALIEGVLAALRDERAAEPEQAIDLHALLQSLADDAVEQGHDVRLQAEPAVVRGQLLALRRIVGNLLGNALRHGGSAVLSLQRVKTGAGIEVQVCVDDPGPGIPEAQLEAVFQPFFRLDTARSRDGSEGVGLGLYIARELAHRQGATLVLANRPEGGLRARLSLPAA